MEEYQKCWTGKGCIYNSNHSWKYMKCCQKYYSVEKCKNDNQSNEHTSIQVYKEGL